MTINDPRDIPGLIAWYSADAQVQADSSNLAQLTDFSGNGNHAAVVSGFALYRTTGGAAGGPRFAWPSQGPYYNTPVSTGASSSEYMGTFKAGGTSNCGGLLLTSGSGANVRYPQGAADVRAGYCRTGAEQADFTPTLAISSWRRVNEWSAANDHVHRLDEVVQNNVTSGAYAAGTSIQWMRDAFGFGFHGDMGGCAIYDHKLTTGERADLAEFFTENPSGGTLFVPEPPSDPTDGDADPGCDDATITWHEPSSGAVTGYDVRLDGGAITSLGVVFTHTFTGLTSDTSYLGEVRATGPDGDSGWLAIPFTTDSLPSAPTSISAAATTASVTATWAAVTDADGYRVRINGGAPIDVGDTLSHTFHGLSPSTEYTVEVQAYNDCGDSDWLTGAPVTTVARIVAQPCPCGDRWVIEACDLATGRVRAILLPVAASWQTILTGLGTGDLTFPVRGVLLRDVWPDLTSIYISRITDTGEYDCQYAGIVEKATGTSTIQGGTMRVGLQPIESYLWRRTLKTDRAYTNTEQTAIAASLVSYATTDGIPLTAVAAASAFSRDRTYLGDERPYLGELLDLLAGAIDGPEWTMLHTRSNGFWSSRILFEDRAGDDRDDILTSDVEGATYGLDVDAGVHATYVDGYANTSTGQIIATAVDNGPYVEFDATPSFGTIEDGTTVQQQSDGYLREHREPVATPSFGIMGDDDPTPENLRLGDTATFHISQGAVSFHGRARVGSISWRLTEGAPAARVLGLIPVERASDSVLNQ